MSLPPSSLIFSCCLPSGPHISPSHPSGFHFFFFFCLSWYPLKSSKNPRFKLACLILVVCDVRQLMNFPEPQFFHLHNEGTGSHLRFVIYSNQGDIHTPAHCALQSLFLLCTAARIPAPPPPCHLANIRQLNYLPASLPCSHPHHPAF